MFSRIGIFLFGVAAYCAFSATLLYFMCWLLSIAVPEALDSPAAMTTWQAIAIDVALIGLFGCQHSVMARPSFKNWWTQYVPQPLERSIYVLASSSALYVLMACWQPVGGFIWEAKGDVSRVAIYSIFALGWAVLFLATLLISHLDLFGLRQVWLHLINRPYTQLTFGTPFLYRLVRHPLYVGWLLIFWAAPTMTAAHLVLATGLSAYILIAIRYEERDLMAVHGEYAAYRKRVPMLVPRLGLTGARR